VVLQNYCYTLEYVFEHEIHVYSLTAAQEMRFVFLFARIIRLPSNVLVYKKLCDCIFRENNAIYRQGEAFCVRKCYVREERKTPETFTESEIRAIERETRVTSHPSIPGKRSISDTLKRPSEITRRATKRRSAGCGRKPAISR